MVHRAALLTEEVECEVTVGWVPEEYDKHLASLHGPWATPPSVVAELVTDVVDSAVVDIDPRDSGEVNEVYDVTLAYAPSLIVRIAHRGADGLEREAGC